MVHYNMISVWGILADNPSFSRRGSTQTLIGEFKVGTKVSFINVDDQEETLVQYFRVTFSAVEAERLQEANLVKDAPIFVQGMLSTFNYTEASTGKEKTSLEIYGMQFSALAQNEVAPPDPGDDPPRLRNVRVPQNPVELP